MNQRSVHGVDRVIFTCDWHVKYTAGLASGVAGLGVEVQLITRDHDHEFGNVRGAMRSYLSEVIPPEVRHECLPGRVSDPGALLKLPALRRRLHARRRDIVHIQDSLIDDPRLAVVSGLPWRRFAMT